jgi:hypothetical protein
LYCLLMKLRQKGLNKKSSEMKWTHYVGLKCFNNHITSKQTVEGTESYIEPDSVLLIWF